MPWLRGAPEPYAQRTDRVVPVQSLQQITELPGAHMRALQHLLQLGFKGPVVDLAGLQVFQQGLDKGGRKEVGFVHGQTIGCLAQNVNSVASGDTPDGILPTMLVCIYPAAE